MRKFAILVGVEKYNDPRISPLQYAGADMLALGKRLKDVCRFDDVGMFGDRDADGPPELGCIIDALSDVAGEVTPEDLFLFFFAGHGVETGGHGYLLVRENRLAFPEHGSLSLALLQETLSKMEAGRRVLLLDACRNDPHAGRGDAANVMGEALSRDIAAAARPSRARGESTAVLAACRSGQRAYEWPSKGHGAFTHFLLQGIDGEAWRGPRLDFRDLARYTVRRVRQWSDKTPGLEGPQEPWYQEFGDAEPITIAVRPEAPPVEERLPEKPPAAQVLPQARPITLEGTARSDWKGSDDEAVLPATAARKPQTRKHLYRWAIAVALLYLVACIFMGLFARAKSSKPPGPRAPSEQAARSPASEAPAAAKPLVPADAAAPAAPAGEAPAAKSEAAPLAAAPSATTGVAPRAPVSAASAATGQVPTGPMTLQQARAAGTLGDEVGRIVDGVRGAVSKRQEFLKVYTEENDGVKEAEREISDGQQSACEAAAFLVKTLDDCRAEYAPLLEKYKPAHPEMTKRSGEIAALEAQLWDVVSVLPADGYSRAGLPYRVPPGFRPAKDTAAEPYTNSGWAGEVIHVETGIEMVFIPAGEFEMGTPPGKDFWGKPDQGDSQLHKVRITKHFYMGKYEVTRQQWQKVMGGQPIPVEYAKDPVSDASWDDCQKFLAKAGDGLRLPTEAEWEYACRAGTKTAYFFGDDDKELGKYAWYTDNSENRTHPVGEKSPNPWGLYDIYGNVPEWCQDWYGGEYYSRSPVDDPQGPTSGDDHVLRGGGYGSGEGRSSNFFRCGSAWRQNTTLFSAGPGVRVVRALDSLPSFAPPAAVSTGAAASAGVVTGESGRGPATANAQPHTSAQLDPLSLHWYGFGQRLEGGVWREFQVQDGMTMYDGDQFRIAFAPAADCYVYILCINADNSVSQLFPSPAIKQGAFCRGGQECQVPDGINWFTLDERHGTETMILLADYDALPELEAAVAKAAGAGSAELATAVSEQVALAEAANRAGADGVTRTRSGVVVRNVEIKPSQRSVTGRIGAGENVERAMKFVEGRAAVVQRIRFAHGHPAASAQ